MKCVTLPRLRTLAAFAALVSLLATGTSLAASCGESDPMPCCKAPGLSRPMACCKTQAHDARVAVAEVRTVHAPFPLADAARHGGAGPATVETPIPASFVRAPRAGPSTVLRI